MNKNEFLYKLQRNKSKLMLVGSILLLVLVVLAGVFVVHRNNFYKTFNSTSSSKYVLADNIIGINSSGKVELFNSKNGKLVDELSLEGNFLVDTSDDFKEAYMLNILNGDFFKLSANKNKIVKEEEKIGIGNSATINSFDYDNGNIAILYNNKKTFSIKDSKSDTFKEFNPGVSNDIDIFRIVNNNLIFTSGEYIYSKNLSTDISNNNDNVKVAQINLKVRDKDNIKGEEVGEIPAGEKVTIISQEETGWYLVESNGLKGYISNEESNFKSVNNDRGLAKIHIGESSQYIHESKGNLYIHNNFGEDRGISILLELNPENLYIKNLTQFNNPTNSLVSNTEDSKLYINEIADSKDIKVRQIMKYGEFEKFDERLGFKFTSETVLDSINSYGMLGYVYYKDAKGINIFNLKSQEKDLTINSKSDFFAPLY